MFLRKIFEILITLIVSPLAIIFYVIFEAEEIAKKIQIKVDKIKKGKK